MVLAVPRPVKRRSSKHLQFRMRIPADVLATLRALPDWERPGWGLKSGEITLSLARQARPGETEKQTHRRLSNEADAVFASVRKGARTLSDLQIGALAGEAYVLASSPDDARSSGPRSSAFDPYTFAAGLVASKGILTDTASINRLAFAIIGERGSLAKATEINAARAAGDYATAHHTFPEWSDTQPYALEQRTGESGKLSTLVSRFLAENTRLKAATLERYRPCLDALVAFLKDPPAAMVAEDDIRRFKHHRVGATRSEATYYRADLAAIKSLFTWATDRDAHAKPPLSVNPAERIRIKSGAQLGQTREDRDRFHEDEIKAILRAASTVQVDNDNPHLSFAKRWCPWVAAYTGARIATITGLAREDVRKEGTVWFIKFPPAKGLLRFREVPVHPHLADLGFLDFVKSRPRGPLFFDPKRKARITAKASQAQIQGNKIAAWVRANVGVKRATVSPNHGWRHTFKSRALEAGIAPQISDAITGHSVRGQGPARSYEHVSLTMLNDALRRFPRYQT